MWARSIIDHVELEEVLVTKHPEPQHEPQSDDTVTPVPNRRERRGGKSGATSSSRGGKSTLGRSPGLVPNPRQYSTRRRSG